MIVGLNLLYLLPGAVGGTETYAAGLLQALAAADEGIRYKVFVNREAERWPLPDVASFERIVCPVRASRRLDRYRWEQLALPRALRGPHRVDLLHSLGYVAPLRAPCPSVLSLHDLNYRAFGDQMPRARRLVLRLFVEQSARRADQVITISHFSKREIVSSLGIPADRVHVTALGPRPATHPASAGTAAAARARLGLDDRPYVLAFSSPSPNKNIPRLLDAFARARSTHAFPHRLVLVGHPPPHRPPPGTVGEVEAAHVRATGYLTDDDLAAVLAGADLLVFPSLYEGFGLPVLESMAAGVPVASSDAASLPEVGGDAVLYFDPRSTDAMADAIGRLAGSGAMRETLRQRGLTRAREFSWARTARETLAVYHTVLGRRPTPAAPLAGIV